MSDPGSWPQQPPVVGFYPLRPLTVGEILGGALRIAWRHIVLLAPLALIVGGVSSIVQLAMLSGHDAAMGILDGTRALPSVMTEDEAQQLVSDFMPALWALAVSLLVSAVLTPVVSGIAAPLVAQAATTRAGSDAGAFQRLSGRWVGLLGAAVLTALAVAAGSLLLVVPGIVIAMGLAVIGPVAAMEGAAPAEALRRSWKLTLGFKWRVFGIMLLTGVFVFIAGMIVSALVGLIAGDTLSYTTSQLVGVLVGAFTGAWSACVTGLIYVDLRIRKEGLADALRRAAS